MPFDAIPQTAPIRELGQARIRGTAMRAWLRHSELTTRAGDFFLSLTAAGRHCTFVGTEILDPARSGTVTGNYGCDRAPADMIRRRGTFAMRSG